MVQHNKVVWHSVVWYGENSASCGIADMTHHFSNRPQLHWRRIYIAWRWQGTEAGHASLVDSFRDLGVN